MKNNRLLSIAIIILAASIIFSSIWIGSKLERNNQYMKEYKQADAGEKALIRLEEAASFLNIDKKTFIAMLSEQSKETSAVNSESYNYIPYIVIQGQKYFTKQELTMWANYNVQRGKRYN